MKTYTVEVKHGLLNGKTYGFNSSIKVKAGDMVLVPRGNKKGFAFVVGCTEGSGDFEKQVIKKASRRKIVSQAIKKSIMKKQFHLPLNVYEKYTKSVKGNENTSYEQAKLKLNRNIILADKLVKTRLEPSVVFFPYGCLRIYVNLKTHEIVSVSNYNQPAKGWEKDMGLYEELNVKFGIVDDRK